MSVNIDAIKAKLEALKNGRSTNSASSNRNKFYKPNGNFTCRIITIPGREDIMREFSWHYNLDEKSFFLCNKRSYPDQNHSCIACDTASQLWKDFEDSGKQNQQFGNLAKKMFATKRFYMPVIIRGQESEGPMIYGFGPKLAQDIYNEVLNPENEGKFLDHEEGFDFNVKFTDKPNSSFKDINGTSAKKPSPLWNDQLFHLYDTKDTDELMEKIFADIPDIDNLFALSDDDAMAQAVNNLVDGLTEQLTTDVNDYEGDNDSDIDAALAKLKS